MTETVQISLATALWRGIRGRCPNCGDGRLLHKYLKVHPTCSSCAEELHHHRADDFPAYLVVAIVGHIVMPLLLWTEIRFAPEYWVHMSIWLPLTLFLALSLLPIVKGGIIALQWHIGMHGFETSKRARATRL
ncbi:MAG: hypothetical protein K0Q70_532 [Rhodospirillales bacterium]|jgi:uncharacterized protein (DUF983 family)|nr:hypothetical protein [Rhodospirillales bacterium]